MASTYLDAIAEFHRNRASQDLRSWRQRLETVRSHAPSLADALARDAGGHVKVIAEVKRRSPSKGWLARDVDAPLLATQYVSGGAAALSVLTDQEHFGGSRHDLESVAAAVRVPILRKDFTVSENDVLDAAEMGASGVLLIAALLTTDELTRFSTLADQVGLTALVEVHERDEALRAHDLGVRVVGVNQRNLHTFEVDPHHAARVISDLPASLIRVAESGLRTDLDVAHAAEAGFDAVLVGESFVRADNPSDAVRTFASVPLVARD